MSRDSLLGERSLGGVYLRAEYKPKLPAMSRSRHSRLTARFRGAYHRTPMQAESLEVLEKASVAPAHARAIVRAIEIELVRAPETLATKNDLAVLGVTRGVSRDCEAGW